MSNESTHEKPYDVMRANDKPDGSLLNNIQAAVIIYDNNNKSVNFNFKAMDLLGLSMDDMPGKKRSDPVWKLLNEDGEIIPGDQHPVHQVLATQKPVKDFVANIHRPDRDNPVWVNLNADPAFDATGRIKFVVVTLIDISYQKAIETKLEKDQKLLNDVLDAMPDMVWLKDADGIYLMCNQELANLVNARKETIIGGTDYDIFPSEKADFYCEHDRKAIDNGTTTINEESADYLHNGYSIWIETSKTPVYDHQGELVGVLGIGRDISRSKQTLKESEEKQDFLNMVVDRSPIPMLICSPNWTALRANQAFYSALHLTTGQTVGKYNLLQDQNLKRADIAEKLEWVVHKRLPVKFDLLWRSDLVPDIEFSSRRNLYIDVSIFPLLNQGLEITHIVVQWVDITERKQAEEKLRAAQDRLSQELEVMKRLHHIGSLFVEEENLKEIMEQILDTALFTTETDKGYLLIYNQGSARIESLSLRGFDQTCRDFRDSLTEIRGSRGMAIKERSRVVVEDITQSRLFTGDPELDILLKAGVRAEQTTPLIGRSGDVLGCITTHFNKPHRPNDDTFRRLDLLIRQATDIIERAKSEEALSISEARYRLLFEYAPIPLWEEDFSEVFSYFEQLKQQGINNFRDYFEGCPDEVLKCSEMIKILEVNRAAIDLHKAQSKNELLQNFKNIITDRSLEAFKEELIALACGRQNFETEGEVKTLAGDPIHIYLQLIIDIKKDGSVNALLATIDITERKLAEVEKQNLQSRLAQAQKMESIGTLAGGVAHDFNNLLSIILGYADLALEKLTPYEPLYDDISEISKAGKRTSEITRQLLAFARQQTTIPKVLDLNDSIESILKMLRRLIGENIDLSWIPGADLWPVKFDPSQIDQILANLCVNARDAIEGVGLVTIETGNTTIDEEYCSDHPGFMPGKFVLIAVSDNGVGIPPESLNKIFDPFFTTKGLRQGTGLGLSTVYGIVKQNNGFIYVYSEEEVGTSIKIYLPRHMGKIDEPRYESISSLPLSQGETIMLVEDDDAILKIGKRMLSSLGYTVLTANAPSKAIKMADAYAEKIHLLLTDVIMPEMNGRQLSAQLTLKYPEMKTIYMSGYTADVVAHRGVLDEGISFIPKPLSKRQMAVKIREMLSGKTA